MSVLETNTIDGVTYDLHDKLVGSGTLQTTAQTLIPAVNEVKSGLATVSGKTDVIGSGSLNTTSQTLIGAVNELNGKLGVVSDSTFSSDFTGTVPSDSGNSQMHGMIIGPITIPKTCLFLFRPTKSSNIYRIYFGTNSSSGAGVLKWIDVTYPSNAYSFDADGYHYQSVESSTTANYYTHIALLKPGSYAFGADAAWGGTITVNYMRLYF